MGLPRHLVWDWNGTLLDDLALVVAATNAALRRAGGPAVDADHHRRRFRRPIADYYAEVLGRPVLDAEFDHLNRVFHDAYQARLPCPLTAGAEAALRYWAGTQSLLSMWFHAELVVTVDSYGLTGRFTRIDGRPRAPGGEVDHKGPYLADHLAALRVAPEDAVLIGDTVDDARAAAGVGAACVLYAGGFTDPDQLRATGAPVAGSLRDAVALARADGDRAGGGKDWHKIPQ